MINEKEEDAAYFDFEEALSKFLHTLPIFEKEHVLGDWALVAVGNSMQPGDVEDNAYAVCLRRNQGYHQSYGLFNVGLEFISGLH